MLKAKTYRDTIEHIEIKYMKNCHPAWLLHWKAKRKEMFARLIEVQLKEFDRS